MYKVSMESLQKVLGQFKKEKKVRQTNARILEFKNGEILTSYGLIVAIHTYGNDPRYHWCFTKLHDYSRTTSKHVKEFCGYNAKERRQGIKKGIFAYVYREKEEA